MSIVLDCALELAQQRVKFFPVRPNSKLPAIADFANKATSNAEQLEKMFGQTNYNSGIACGKIAEGLYLVGFDIDVKNGNNGFETLDLLTDVGCVFPDTWSQKTPTGGEHRLFWSPVPIRQGVNVLGKGIDLRGDGGYLVGPGSKINGEFYTVIKKGIIAKFSDWAIEKYQRQATVHSIVAPAINMPVENQILALKQSTEYLLGLEPATAGSRSDGAFRAAAQLKNYGLEQGQAFDVMAEHFKSEPAIGLDELRFVVGNAYRYSSRPKGVDAPEHMFTPEVAPPTPLEKDPIDRINESHFYIAENRMASVCWETQREGRFYLARFPVSHFHEKNLSDRMAHNGKDCAVTEVWMRHKNRRTYDFMRFDPTGRLAPNEYNLWRGFAVSPYTAEKDAIVSPKANESVQLFLEHCEKNICGGDKELTRWLIGFMAHIFQFPGEKPEVSLVFQGKKGTGKTIVSEILNHLIGINSVIVSDKAHAIGHFNSMMEDKLLVTLDEAFWSGDKSIEGILKHIITGGERIITHKGAEGYKAKVFDRIIIVGNEQWLVPASADERRFAVFAIGNARQQDRVFFGAMKNGLMNHGGDALLMRFFLNYSLEGIDVNCAPQTEALMDQKELSLGVFERYWQSCLQEGQILGSGIEGWPTEISAKVFYSAFTTQLGLDHFRGHQPNHISVGLALKKLCGEYKAVYRQNTRTYVFKDLESMRIEWDINQRCKTNWGSEALPPPTLPLA